MKAIAATDRNWGIGLRGNLLVRIPADMKMFREETEGKVVILGRKTLESFPGGKPLKNRVNIVLSRNPGYTVEGAEVVHDIHELLKILEEKYGDYGEDNVFVIGGAELYRQLLPFCDTILITRIEKVFEADVYFPNLDEDRSWKRTVKGENETFEDLTYHFDRYERI